VNVVTCDWDCNKRSNNPNGAFSGVTLYNWCSELIKEPEHCTILFFHLLQGHITRYISLRFSYQNPVCHFSLINCQVYSATADLHNSQITAVPTKPFPAFFVFTSRSLASAPNIRDSSASHAEVPSSQTTVQNSLSCPNYLGYNILARTNKKAPLPTILRLLHAYSFRGNIFTE
jgi:hypothetical protein